jgi:hypothetical protein
MKIVCVTHLEIEMLKYRLGSVVRIATRNLLDGPVFERQWGQEIFLLSMPVQTGPGANQASCTLGTGALSQGVLRPRRDVYHWFAYSTEVRKECICTSSLAFPPPRDSYCIVWGYLYFCFIKRIQLIVVRKRLHYVQIGPGFFSHRP